MVYDELLGPGAGAHGLRQPAPRALLRVHGADAIDFVQRLCSQDVAGMAPGRAAPAAFFTGKGKLVATSTAGRSRAPDEVWLETSTDQVETLAELLDRYHFTEQLAIERAEGWTAAEIVGPDAPALVGLGVGELHEIDGGGVVVTGGRHGLSWVRYHAPEAFFAQPPWQGADVVPLSDEQAEVLRICAGVVRVGGDTEPTTLGMEADLDDHVSATKGCYTGQEIVARIATYGHVNRQLRLVEIRTADQPDIGTALVETEEGDPVGRVMTTAVLPDGERLAGLAFLPQDFWAGGTSLRLGALDGPEVRVVDFAAD